MDQAPQEVELDRSVVMSRRFQLVEEMAIIGARHKAELEPKAEELKLCEMYIKDTMNKAGEQQVKTTSGDMCYFVTKDSVTVKDMDPVIKFMLEAAPPLEGYTPEAWAGILQHFQARGLWGLLNKAVNKTVAKEIIEANKAPPPGVEYSAFKDLAWRRGAK